MIIISEKKKSDDKPNRDGVPDGEVIIQKSAPISKKKSDD